MVRIGTSDYHVGHSIPARATKETRYFVGGVATRADGSLAVYRPKESAEYLKELEQALATSTLP